tara:strand:- start:1437 stop:3068 length:1632 start_codon:yes stop_codon:yes gene_type:complete
MCGFTSYIGSSLSEKDFRELSSKIAYRGPDKTSFFSQDSLMVGFHRLSIIGEGEAGDQPIWSKDKKVFLVCNGEIYNYKKLILDYKLSPSTKSDCEVILLLYNKIGIEKTLKLLDGVFCFFLHDYNTGESICARDPFGVRPGFIGKGGAEDWFIASEAKAIPDNGFDVIQFPPGKWWSSFDKETFKTYFSKSFAYKEMSEDDILKKVRSNLVSAVEKRLMSEKEIGCLLSGGLDSSLISAIVCKLNDGYRLVNDEWKLTNKPNKVRIKTFSIGMGESPDLLYAKKVADFIGSDHYEVRLSSSDFLSAIPDVIYKIESYDTTTVRASVGNYLVSKAIRELTNCKVIFNGDGSDEVCCGYVYNVNAPTDLDIHLESERLLREIHIFDVLRSDRSISSNGLEARTPFLDKEFVKHYMSIDPSLKRFDKKSRIEKFILRKAFEKDNILPDSVLWRHKCAFSDGVSNKSNSWHTIIQKKVESIISDDEFNSYVQRESHCTPHLKESYYYRKIFNSKFSGLQNLIPHFWMPKWSNTKDPSARELESYKE